MRSLIGLGAFVLLSGSTLLHADGTLHYKSQFKLAAAFPAAVQQVVNQSADVPQEMIIRFKGDKTYSNTGKMILVSESRKQEVTAMAPAGKLFATVYAKDFPGEIVATIPTMPLMPPNVQKILESIKPNVSVRRTGRTDHISGIEAEETELTISMEMPVPAGVPAGMFQPGETITIMKMVMQIWNATPAEVTRVQVLGEMASHTSKMLMPNPSDGMRQLFASFPGFGDTFAAMMDQLSQNRTPMLRSHTQTFVPVLAQLSAFMQAQGQQLPGGFDANSPLGESNTELAEISDAPVDDSLFEIPSDYRATSLPDLMKALHPNLSTPGLPGRTIPNVP